MNENRRIDRAENRVCFLPIPDDKSIILMTCIGQGNQYVRGAMDIIFCFHSEGESGNINLCGCLVLLGQDHARCWPTEKNG